jgi:flagellar basal body-associated protein FliL
MVTQGAKVHACLQAGEVLHGPHDPMLSNANGAPTCRREGRRQPQLYDSVSAIIIIIIIIIIIFALISLFVFFTREGLCGGLLKDPVGSRGWIGVRARPETQTSRRAAVQQNCAAQQLLLVFLVCVLCGRKL